MDKEMKTLNGYEVVDAKAREDIEQLKTDSASYQTEEQVNTLINNALGVIENGTY